jgi:hemerythrin superfamily protein
MNILSELKKDHDEVLDLFSQIEEAKEHDRKKQLLEEIIEKLIAHNDAEEDIFYNRLKNEGEQDFLAIKGEEAHDLAEDYIEELRDESEEIRWEAKLGLLRMLIKNHIDEEEKEVFEAASQSFSVDELEEMGKEFSKAKKED